MAKAKLRAIPEYKVSKRRQLLKLYGLTLEDYASMLAGQGGLCALCGREFGPRGPAVDHDHVSGVVRGLLCVTCNTGLGAFRDDPSTLLAAIDYLARNRLKVVS